MSETQQVTTDAAPSDPEDDRLVLEDVVDVNGRAVEGRTIEVQLDDGRVLVGRIRQVQTGEVHCPAEGCFRRFDSEKGLQTHLGKFHPDFNDDPTCPTCGDVFERSHTGQTYCSVDCYHNHGNVTLTCEHCGEDFQCKRSHAEQRRHCSRECYHANGGPPGRQSNTREERTCPECGDTFETYPSQDQTHCSSACFSASRTVTTTCEMCGREFDHSAARDPSYCGNACRHEGHRADDRPTDVHELLHELHHVEEWPAETAAKRALATLGADSEWTVEALVEEIDAAALADLELPGHVTAARVREAVADAETVFEVQQALRISREQVRKAVRRLDLEDDIDNNPKDMLDNARAALGIDDDQDDDHEPGWAQYSKRGGRQ